MAVSAALGFAIWALSPVLTGAAEPWDASGPYYLAASLAGGGALGLLLPRYSLRSYLGAWCGQVVALAVLPDLDRGWLLLGVFTTAIGSICFLLGHVAGRILRRIGHRMEGRR